jgi:hypothetical protein
MKMVSAQKNAGRDAGVHMLCFEGEACQFPLNMFSQRTSIKHVMLLCGGAYRGVNRTKPKQDLTTTYHLGEPSSA